MRRVWVLCVVFIPLTALACWQYGQETYVIENTEIKGTFTYEHVGIQGATLRLLDSAGRTISNSHTDKNGAFVFYGLKPGNYKLRMLKPSYESVDIKLVQPQSSKSLLKVNFFADYCEDVQVVAAQ